MNSPSSDEGEACQDSRPLPELGTVEPPKPTYRLVPSKFPPIGLFDTVSTAADLVAVMELAGWTNDRLVAERIARLPRSEWVYGRPNASVIMASFLHVASGGMRFNGPELGAWYASADLRTAAAEVGHHLRREAMARSLPQIKRTYRSYSAQLEGQFVDIGRARNAMTDGQFLDRLYDPLRYEHAQRFGEVVRGDGRDGIIFGSIRMQGGTNAVAYRPSKVLDVLQADHFTISVLRDERRITLERPKSD